MACLRCYKHPDVSFRARAPYALGRLGDPAAIPALHLALKDEEEKIRRMSAFALGELKDASAVPELIAISRNEDEFYDVRETAANSLRYIDTREARIAYKDWQRYDERN